MSHIYPEGSTSWLVERVKELDAENERLRALLIRNGIDPRLAVPARGGDAA